MGQPECSSVVSLVTVWSVLPREAAGFSGDHNHNPCCQANRSNQRSAEARQQRERWQLLKRSGRATGSLLESTSNTDVVAVAHLLAVSQNEEVNIFSFLTIGMDPKPAGSMLPPRGLEYEEHFTNCTFN